MLYTNGKCVAYYMWAPPQAVSNRKHLFPKVTNLEKEKFWDWEKCWSFQFLVLTNYPWITNNIKVISGLSFWSLAVLSDLPFFPINMFSPQAILSLWRIQVWQQNKMDIRHLQQSLQLGKMVNWFSCICPYVLESIVLVFLYAMINNQLRRGCVAFSDQTLCPANSYRGRGEVLFSSKNLYLTRAGDWSSLFIKPIGCCMYQGKPNVLWFPFELECLRMLQKFWC